MAKNLIWMTLKAILKYLDFLNPQIFKYLYLKYCQILTNQAYINGKHI